MPFVFRQLDISTDVLDLAEKHDFEIRGYAFDAFREDVRSPRKVKVGVIQNKMVLPTTATVLQQVSDVTLACNVPLNCSATSQCFLQRDAVYERLSVLIEAAGKSGVDILCLQELWSATGIYFG